MLAISKPLKIRDFLNECCKPRSAAFKCESGICIAMDGVSPFSPSDSIPPVAYRGGPGARSCSGPNFLPASVFVEQGRELLDQRAAKLLGVHDGHRPLVVAGHIVADADRG